MDFGFSSFELFIKSDLMRKYVCVDLNKEGNVIYLPQDDPKIAHIRENQKECYMDKISK